MAEFALLNGDCLEVLKTLPADSVDSLVTDPPAGISFMGKDWDSDKGGSKEWIKWMSQVMRECLRVLKPGAHALVWAIPRTSHWTATACEDAGFEIRDVVTHVFGSGFPKSLDISKAIDKAAGATRPTIGLNPNHRRNKQGEVHDTETMCGEPHSGDGALSLPATAESKLWQGWGTALKPASEHWILCRKPISEKTVAANVLKYGTGGINIDASRIGSDLVPSKKALGDKYAAFKGNPQGEHLPWTYTQGRFPANLVLSCFCSETEHHFDSCAVAELDRQSGVIKGEIGRPGRKAAGNYEASSYKVGVVTQTGIKDSGGASRFFYCAKASKRERNEGCEGQVKEKQGARPNSKDMSGKFPDHDHRPTGGNNHPTVKPLKLMTYLIRMITPPGGIVLDPFMGSGSTGVAAVEAFDFIGIERELEYFQIAEKRITSKTRAT